MRSGIIYCATCMKDGRKYYGKTVETLEKRRKRHLYDVKQGSTLLFHNMLRKHEFSWIVVETCDAQSLNEREMFYIARDQTSDSRFGLNLTKGGDGTIPNDETRLKMSIAAKGRSSPLKGTKLSIEHRQKLALAKLGKKRSPRSEETKKKISESNRLTKSQMSAQISERLRGHPVSLETRAKISAANKGRVVSDEHRKKLSDAQKARRQRERSQNETIS